MTFEFKILKIGYIGSDGELKFKRCENVDRSSA